jgi:tRNA threonylcarbamoyladenosine modification (KEOPS) complex  Pcc1 subunit
MAHLAAVAIDIQGDVARGVEAAISVEAAAGLPRVRAALTRRDHGLDLRLESDDVPSLRAALNSYLRWTDLAAIVSGRARGMPVATDGRNEDHSYEV